MRPLRVYVGLNSAEEVEERAALVLAEMIRVGAFERSVLVVVVPTGTGWMDPAAMDTLEYLHGGDTAIVGMQYSYLTSWISLLVEPGYSTEAGRALFRAVYEHWTELPRDARPRLYLHGLSLGAFGSQQSVRLHEMIGDPVQGAVWSGPPFSSPIWSAATRDRNPGTPAWLPRVRRRLDPALHQPGEPSRHPRRDLGADADRLPAVRQRPDHLLHPRRALAQARLDEAADAAPTSRPSCAGTRW